MKKTGNKPQVKQKKRLNTKGYVFLTILLAFVIAISVWILSNFREDESTHPFQGRTTEEETTSTSILPTVETCIAESDTTTCTIPEEVAALNISLFNDVRCSQGVLIHADSGEIVDGLLENQRGYPASLTKMMTAIVAIENLPDLDDTYTLTLEISDAIYGHDLSIAGYEVDETLTYYDYLCGCLMRSGAECCLALADGVCGKDTIAESEDVFVDLMNEKAEQLGLTNTHFENCTGEHDDNHYSTPYDMARILAYCLKNDTFREIIEYKSYTTTATEKFPDGHFYYSTIYYATPDMSEYEDLFQFIGGKTGYTDDSGQCLASASIVNGQTYVLVTFGATNFENAGTRHLGVKDMLQIMSQFSEALGNKITTTETTAETAESSEVSATSDSFESSETSDVTSTEPSAE